MYTRKIRIENIRCFRGGERGVELGLTRPDGASGADAITAMAVILPPFAGAAHGHCESG